MATFSNPLTNDQEPTDEQLGRLMHCVRVEAERKAKIAKDTLQSQLDIAMAQAVARRKEAKNAADSGWRMRK